MIAKIGQLKDFIKNNKKKVLFGVFFFFFVLSVGFAGYLGYNKYVENDKLIKSLKNEKANIIEKTKQLESQISQLNITSSEKDKIIEADKSTIIARDTEIQNLKKEIEFLKSSSSRTSLVRREGSTSVSSGSIYDRIKITSSFRNQIFRALDLLKAYDNSNYQMINQQVNYIYEDSECGGIQIKRNIYIGNCGGSSSDIVIASVMVHEATHVYNVYVRKIYSYNTKEQELPAYQAELATAQKLGAPQYFIDYINQQINYWNSM